MNDNDHPFFPETRSAGRSPLRLVILLGLVVLLGAGLLGWAQYTGPKWTWRRAIGASDARAKAWTRLQSDREIEGLGASETASEVFRALEDPDAETRGWAISTIPRIKVEAAAAIKRIASLLSDPDVSVRTRAAMALGEVFRRGGPGHDEAVAALAGALKDSDPAVRVAAVASIGQVVYEGGVSSDPLLSGRFEDPALDLVAPLLRDEDMTVRVEAACVLGRNRRRAEAVPMLLDFVRGQPRDGPLSYLADRAVLALMLLTLQSDQAAAFLAAEMDVVREGYPDRPRDALAWAARQSPEALSRVRRIAWKGLRSEDITYRHNCAILMGDIGQGPAALPELISALDDPSTDLRIRAVEAIADLGNADPSILPALRAAANDADRRVREHALGAIDEIELGLEIGEIKMP